MSKVSAAEIVRSLRTEIIGRKLICLETVDSTNSEAKRRSGAEPEGTVIISEEQTAGRGRLGREWTSPKGKGIWMSVLLKPDLPLAKIPQLTTVAGAVLCLALESVDATLHSKVKIKWPNDILVREKKAGGILTEMLVNGDRPQSVVLGIGLNVSLEAVDFPAELRPKATSFLLETGCSYDRNKLIAAILNVLEPYYNNFLETGQLGESLTICRLRSAVMGRRVLLLKGEVEEEAQVLDIGPQGELIVKLADGTVSSIVSGEISLRITPDKRMSLRFQLLNRLQNNL